MVTAGFLIAGIYGCVGDPRASPHGGSTVHSIPMAGTIMGWIASVVVALRGL